MGLKPPAIQNRSRRKKFFMEHIDYPNALPALFGMLRIDLGNVLNDLREGKIKEDQFNKRRDELVNEWESNVKAWKSTLIKK